jgi:hypothetical protein
MRRVITGLLFLGAVTLGAAGCNDNNDPLIPTTPTTPTTPAATVTETFSGKLNTNGASTFPFTATAGGTVTLTLSNVSGADATLPVGMSLGTWTGSACQVVIANDNAAQTAVISGTVTSAASLCARVYDTGRVATAIDFTVTIVHP